MRDYNEYWSLFESCWQRMPVVIYREPKLINLIDKSGSTASESSLYDGEFLAEGLLQSQNESTAGSEVEALCNLVVREISALLESSVPMSDRLWRPPRRSQMTTGCKEQQQYRERDDSSCCYEVSPCLFKARPKAECRCHIMEHHLQPLKTTTRALSGSGVPDEKKRYINMPAGRDTGSSTTKLRLGWRIEWLPVVLSVCALWPAHEIAVFTIFHHPPNLNLWPYLPVADAFFATERTPSAPRFVMHCIAYLTLSVVMFEKHLNRHWRDKSLLAMIPTSLVIATLLRLDTFVIAFAVLPFVFVATCLMGNLVALRTSMHSRG